MKTILLVDDDRAIIEVLGDLLEAEGYAVVSAMNGAEGLACAIDSRPDLVLLDLMMPVLDGSEMLDEMRRRPDLRGVPVLMLSAAPSARLVGHEEPSAFLKKPVSLDLLLGTIQRLLEGAEGGRA